MRWTGNIACMRGENAYRISSEDLKGKPLGRPRHRWEDNIRMDLREMGCGGVD
jgi:hypothetical protein